MLGGSDSQVHREYVVFDGAHIYPEYVVYYRLDSEEEEASARQRYIDAAICAKHAPSAGIWGRCRGVRCEADAGSHCEKKSPGEADLQEDARLAASLVKMHTGSCG